MSINSKKEPFSKEYIKTEYKRMLEFCQDNDIPQVAELIKAKLKAIEEPLKLMIVGEGKSGKSTLLNALVGAEIAEVDDEPKTWCINIYQKTKGEPYAELVYSDYSKTVSVDEAKAILDRISSKDKSGEVELTEEERGIEEIHWHLHLAWPDEDIILIDTPGFNQVRSRQEEDKATDNETIQIGQGIHYEVNDGFEKYYAKSDIVLWCFQATSVGDAVVESKLQAVAGLSKKIYGIVTKLDREDEKNRERLFKRNESYYSKYIASCLRSGLPTIYKDDSADEAAMKLRSRRETIDGIKRCIAYLLTDANARNQAKLQSEQNNLAYLRRIISSISYQKEQFYIENYDIYARTLKQLDHDITEESRLASGHVEDLIRSRRNQLLNSNELLDA